MTATLIFLIIGILFIIMALSASVLKRLPLSTSLIYLAVGYLLGPSQAGLINIDIVVDAVLVEHITEIAVIVSLFTAGLKLRVEWSDPLWRLPLRLATVSMVITVGLIAVIGVIALGLPIGAAVLLGAVLAPTDPVLASDVQVANPKDRERLRFGLTGEAGLNDGTAFPFVMLGLGLLGYHEIGGFGWRWFGVDLVWATIGGLAIGGLLGTAVGHLVLYLRREHKEAVGLDDFLALGLIAVAYGSALLIHAYGFLAVFAAGLALRRIEQRTTGADLDAVTERLALGDESAAVEPDTAPAFMAQALLIFNEQLERIGEVAVVVLVGAMLAGHLTTDAVWFIPVLLLAVRPVAVAAGLLGSGVLPAQRWLMSWFGIRGIGSLYYLAYALAHGLEGPVAATLADLTLAAIAVSVLVHGVSVTPLMNRYDRHLRRASRATPGRGKL